MSNVNPHNDSPRRRFINQAHKNGCQIHGLGFTNTQEIDRYKFDSVESTSWVSGGRFGTLFVLEGNQLKQRKDKHRRNAYRQASLHNLRQWIDFVNMNDRGEIFVPHQETIRNSRQSSFESGLSK